MSDAVMAMSVPDGTPPPPVLGGKQATEGWSLTYLLVPERCVPVKLRSMVLLLAWKVLSAAEGSARVTRRLSVCAGRRGGQVGQGHVGADDGAGGQDLGDGATGAGVGVAGADSGFSPRDGAVVDRQLQA